MIPGINNKESRQSGASPLNRIFKSIDDVDNTAAPLKLAGYSYKAIGHALLDTLRSENEPLIDFLTDWDEYVTCLIYDIDLETKLCWDTIQVHPAFKQLLRIVHSFTLECLRSRYIETGIDCHLSLTISEFLTEIFDRYHMSIDAGTSTV